MSYPKEKLGNYIEVESGYAFKSKDFIDSGIPIIKIKNITPPSVSLEELSYVSAEVAKSHSAYFLHYDDVLIALTGSHINQMNSVVGRVARVKYPDVTLLNQRVGRVIVTDSIHCNLDYVYYFLSQPPTQISLASNAGGAANQANISPGDVKNLLIPFPDIRTQKEIASILRAYDDLIENNQKQIKLLEEAAQRLYKKWFVDLRFPGYENTKIVDGVPEGWKYRLVSDFGTIITGKTPSTSKAEYYGGDVPFVTIPDMHGKVFSLTTEKTLSRVGADTQTSKYLPANTILVSCIATVGLVNITTEKCQTNQQINAVVLSQAEDLYFLYEAMLQIKELLGGVGSNGATMTNVNKTKFSNIDVLYPTSELVYEFNNICRPIFKKILILSKIILNALEARDRLLPKLMSGEMSGL